MKIERCGLSRREFIKAVALASTTPFWARMNAFAVEAAPVPIPNQLLMVLFLQGGNDGLNTVAPYLDGAYKTMRPTIALKPNEVFPIGSGLGIHKSLPRVNQMWHEGQVAILQNVGYPNPNFSHFDSTDIWETASPDRKFHTGWLGRYLDHTDTGDKGPVRAVAVGTPNLPRTITGNAGTGVTLNSLSDFDFADSGLDAGEVALRRAAFGSFQGGASGDGSMHSKILAGQEKMADAVEMVSGAADNFTIANPTPAQTVAQMFSVGVGTEIGFIGVGAFDTHVGQPQGQADSLKEADDAIAAFFDTAASLGLKDRATVITFSDFGRRVGENAGSGTDHGTSMPMFVLGPRVNGGLYGNRPDLTELEDGNLVMEIPMQSVYASVLEQAFNVDPDPIIGASYPTLPLIG
jgi:uncharacterized protein (DUF1501 family)